MIAEPTPEQIERARAEVWRKLHSRIAEHERRQRVGWLRRWLRNLHRDSQQTR